MSKANRFRHAVMWLGVVLLLVGGLGSLSAGPLSATSIMALSLAGALLLLDLTGKPEPRSAKSIAGFGLLIVAVSAALVIVYERL